MRRGLSGLLIALLAVPAAPVRSAAALGAVEGTVTLEGRPVSGVDVVLMESNSGTMVRARSTSKGAFQAKVAPGSYLVTTEGQRGIVVGRAPSVLPVSAGRVASANIELLALAVPVPQETPPVPEVLPEGAGTISMQPEFTCFVAGEFPLLSAQVAPAEKVARIRVYFKSALGDAYYYIEALPGENGFWEGKLPRPKIEASPITYYWQGTFTDFGETTAKEIDATVVTNAEECGDKPVAPFGPAGPVQVFSAASGATVAPAGFAAGALGAGAIAAIIAGAIGAGIFAGVVINNPPPSTVPSSRPPPTLPPPPTTRPGPPVTIPPSPRPGPPTSPFR